MDTLALVRLFLAARDFLDRVAPEQIAMLDEHNLDLSGWLSFEDEVSEDFDAVATFSERLDGWPLALAGALDENPDMLPVLQRMTNDYLESAVDLMTDARLKFAVKGD